MINQSKSSGVWKTLGSIATMLIVLICVVLTMHPTSQARLTDNQLITLLSLMICAIIGFMYINKPKQHQFDVEIRDLGDDEVSK